jgi:adenosine deaminase
MNRRDVFALPKAHLHLHLEGSARPETVAELAVLEGLTIPAPVFSSLPEFLVCYQAILPAIRRPESLARVCREVIEDDAAQGVVYSQPMVCPTYYAERLGLSLEGVWATMREAFEGAARAAGIAVGYLVGIDRARPVEQAEAAASFAAAHAGDGIVGFGFGGDERVPPGKLARACDIAREAGLMIVPHAGESVGPESVRAALALRPRRIAHGVRTAESPALLARLAGEGIACDVCPTSNLRLGVVSDLAAHQLPILLEAGVPVTLNSDDQLFFGSRVAEEYALARDAFGLTDAELAAIARTSARVSGAPPPVVARIEAGIDAWLTP